MLSHVYTYTYIHVYTIGHRALYGVYTCMHTCMYMCIYVYTHVHVHCMSIYGLRYVHMSSDDVMFGHVQITKLHDVMQVTTSQDGMMGRPSCDVSTYDVLTSCIDML